MKLGAKVLSVFMLVPSLGMPVFAQPQNSKQSDEGSSSVSDYKYLWGNWRVSAETQRDSAGDSFSENSPDLDNRF